jgi:hypothetical protein
MIGRAGKLALTILFGAGFCVRAQTAGGFTATGSMTTPRQFHTATLLTNGKVLVTGGLIPCCTTWASAELYDPSAGTFTATGAMASPRYMHTATLLPSGKVLIAGGAFGQDNFALNSAELYDSATGTFSPTGVMTSARYFHTATLLNNGLVLIAGGHASGEAPLAELYDPSTGIFTSTGLTDGGGTATLLPNGKVLFADSGIGELYDPATGTFTRTGAPIDPGTQPAAVLLTNGKVLIAGGDVGDGFVGTASASIYDPATGAFSLTGSMTAGIDDWLAGALLPDGKVLISGENRTSGCENSPSGCLGTAELYDPITGTFSSPGNSQSEEGHAETLLPDGTLLISGGWYFCGFMPAPGCGGTLANAEIYHPGLLVSAPQLFSVSGDGKGQGAIWHSATGEIAASSSPAVAGDALSMYAANLAEGGVIPPLVAISGKLAEILYFGDAPRYSGYFQVNFRVPNGVTAGPAVAVRLTYLGRPSNELSIAVQ